MTNKNYLDELPNGEVVEFGQVLNALKKRGIIESYDSQFKYIDGHDETPGFFEYCGHRFTLRYFSGCFYPYVVKVDEIVESNHIVFWGAIL